MIKNSNSGQNELSIVEDNNLSKLYSYLPSPSIYLSKDEQLKNIYSFVKEKSRSNLNKFVYEIKSNRNEFISFLGAGISNPLGIPLWDKLINEMNKYFGVNKKNLEIDIPSQMENIYLQCQEKNQKDEYYSFIKNKLKATTITSSSLFVNLIICFRQHITLNLDTSLEDAYKFLSRISKYIGGNLILEIPEVHILPNLKLITADKVKPKIYHLHGEINNKNSWVMRTPEYELYYGSFLKKTIRKDNSIKTFLTECYKNSHMIIVGVSFKDEYIKKIIEEIAREEELANIERLNIYGQQNNNQTYHFLIIPFSEKEFLIKNDQNTIEYEASYNKVEDYLNKLEKMKIYPIFFNEDEYVFIEELFENSISSNNNL